MFFSVKELELKKARFDVVLPVGAIEYADPGLRQLTPLEASGSVELDQDTIGDIRVLGHLKVTMEADCDRCLESARSLIDSSFDLLYRPAPKINGHKGTEEVEIDDDESEIAFYLGSGLELNDILREHILLSMPMQRICRESCKGICPQCGENRNTAACGCQAKSADDRWEALKSLSTRGI